MVVFQVSSILVSVKLHCHQRASSLVHILLTAHQAEVAAIPTLIGEREVTFGARKKVKASA